MDENRADEKSLDYLYEALLCLKTMEECAAFLDDLCTSLELKALSQRMMVAKMLSDIFCRGGQCVVGGNCDKYRSCIAQV